MTGESTDGTGARWQQPKVLRALFGLVFVVGVFVVAPVVAMLLAAS
jgi:hypothetical protein